MMEMDGDEVLVIYRYYDEMCLFLFLNNKHFLDFLDFKSERQRQQAWGWEHPNM